VQSAQILKRPDGSEYLFGSTNNGVYLGQFNPEVTLVQDGTDWVFTDTNDSRERYNQFGQLISMTTLNGRVTNLSYDLISTEGGDDNLETLDKVTDSYDRSLLFSYEDNNDQPRLSHITTPDGTISYGYDTNGNLASVTYPDEHNKTYQYEDNRFPHHLTGITDENNARFASWAYNAEGKATLSEHAGGAERVSLTYNADGTTSVTGTLGDVRVYDFELAQGRLKVKDISGDRCATCGSGDKQNRSYEANGFPSLHTDWNGNITQTVYNTLGLETSRTEAKDTPEQRAITTQWHADYRLPTQISKPGQVTDLDYDAGRLIRRTITDTQSDTKRITTYSYYTSGSKLGLLQSMDGSRIDINDVTTYDYNANGDLTTVTNPLGQTTTLSNHDTSGRPQTITDANGQVTQLGYTPRGWLKSEDRDGQITVYDYDNVGQLIKLTLPDASFSEYTYDAAHRLTDIKDNLGNTVHYTLDAMGNHKKTETKDPSGNLTRLLEQEYNQLSQLQLSIGGEGQITHYEYDLNGNQTTITDPRNTSSDRVSDDVSATYQYNALDQLIKVFDANGLDTVYTYNALGDLLAMISPDTGSATYTYDEAGNRLSQTDARGITTSYTYDALNRVTTISYPDSSLNITYTYDENNTGQNGIGRLTTMTDTSGITQYSYDLRGNLTVMTTIRGAVTLTTGYIYNGNDQLIKLTYPSGRSVDYDYDTASRINQVTTTDVLGTTEPLLTNINYQPFGSINHLVYGNNLSTLQDYDLDDRQTSLNTVNILERSYGFDTANNITDIHNTLDVIRNQDFMYDGLSRLNDAQGRYGSVVYQYDKTSNRTQRKKNSTTDNYPDTGGQR
jgi:YD repeat-containing protein